MPLVCAIRDGDVVQGKEMVRISAQGRRLSLLCNAGPIRDREGRITGGIVAWRDIAALKEAQSETEAALQALFQRETCVSARARSATACSSRPWPRASAC